MTEQEYISLIVRDFNNELNSIEKKALGSWISKNEEHERISTAFKNDWEKAADYKSNLTIDKSSAWQNIESKIAIEKEIKVVSISHNKKWLRIAAMLVLALTTTFFVKNIFNNGFIIEQTAQNETKSINLPDGSTVVLNENSSLKYKEVFNKRVVSLEGEAFFDVTKDKEHPFTVNVNRTTTQVLGTSFNMDAHQNGKVELALLTGKVKFSNTKNNSIILLPGEKAVYDEHTASFSMRKQNNENSISWKTNKLVFDNTNLLEVVKDLNDYYKTEITLTSSDVNCSFTGTFENAAISEVLDVISFSLNAEVKLSNNVYSITSIECN